MRIETYTVGMIAENCYLCFDESGTAAVIDPGAEPEMIWQEIEDHQLKLEAILLTHGHYDHIGGVEALKEMTGAKIYITEKDAPCLTVPGKALRPVQLVEPDVLLHDEDVIQAGKMTFRCMETPGHTVGSCIYLCGNAMFSGDTLFAGSCGRTDLPGGNTREMIQSLRKIAKLTVNYNVYPGHGPDSELDYEKDCNPYLQMTDD